MEVFDRLLAATGPRHWWPADSPFEVIIGAILTQNTQWRNVPPAIDRMKASGFWSFEQILNADSLALVEAVRPAGCYNVKSRKLKAFAKFICTDFDGNLDALFSLEIEDLRKTLLGVWGIGEETADDIVLYAACKPSFVMDRYTMRIVDRLGWQVGGPKYRDYQRLFTERLPLDVGLFNEYHALLDGHAAKICKSRVPLCSSCVLVDMCETGRNVMKRPGDDA